LNSAELAFADLINAVTTDIDLQSPVLNAHAVNADSALLYHPECLRCAAYQLGIFEEMGYAQAAVGTG
jgi:hypothetical protein